MMQKGDAAKLKLLLSGISARLTKNRDFFVQAVCTFTSGKKKFDAQLARTEQGYTLRFQGSAREVDAAGFCAFFAEQAEKFDESVLTYTERSAVVTLSVTARGVQMKQAEREATAEEKAAAANPLLDSGRQYLIRVDQAAALLRVLQKAQVRDLCAVAGLESGQGAEEFFAALEKGLLSDLAAAINRGSEKLMLQDRELKKKESARANWISGVSHDIRTPLSMVLGYAGQLEESGALSEEDRRKASIIRQQGLKMKNLINDLNLASKLEYNMQPLHPEPVNLVAVARQCAADFINADLAGKYPLDWKTDENLTACVIQGDKALLRRAVNNLLNNAQAHNPAGCTLSVAVREDAESYILSVEDDGVGISDEQLEKLRNTPHYMMSDNGTEEPRHGLGLLIVRQIMRAHRGDASFGRSASGGFLAALQFPREQAPGGPPAER